MNKLFSFLLAVSLIVVTQVEAQSPTDLANMARLVGNWRRVTQQDKSNPDNDHYTFSLNRNTVVVILVYDKDDVTRDILKGDKVSSGSFRLTGRRLNGIMKIGRTVPLTGIVSEDFKRIDWKVPMPGGDTTLLRE